MTRAIILAAGEGNRLRPHTEDRPKALVPLAGKPLLEWQLEVLGRVGVSDITIATGYRADQLESYGTRRVHNPRFDSTNMVVSLIAAREQLLSGDDLLIAYGDIIYQPNIVKALLADEADVSITIDLGWQSLWAMRMEDPLEDAETLRLDDDGNVIELGNPPKSLDEIEGQYMG
ncbi:MAG: NTP transferase domain-containing protein, partial [Actinobacteria bacterium]|nr:NTP transferase domain-containing protein [Actinomycetota bacterium]